MLPESKKAMFPLAFLMLLAFSLTTFIKPANAQYGSPYWKITCTRTGQVTSTGPNGNQTANWNTPDELRLLSQSLSPGQSASISTSGTYHIRLEWMMPDGSTPAKTIYLPPKNVVVSAAAYAGWGGPGNSSSGNADNGIGTPQIVSSSGYGYMNYGGARGVKYEIKDGSSGLIEYDKTVSATVTGTLRAYGNLPYSSGGPSGSSGVSVTEGLNAGAESIIFGLQGTTLDENNADNILIGQNCAAGVFANAPVSINNFSWSIAGSIFASYNIAPDQETGTKYPFINWHAPGVNWLWSDENGAGQVSYTADVYALGQNIGSISDQRTISVWKPNYDMWGVAGPVSYAPGQSNVHAGAPDINDQPGLQFHGWASTPDLFGGVQAGNWALAQLCWLDDEKTLDVFGFPITVHSVAAGELDNGYPYGGTYRADGRANDIDEDSPSWSLESNVSSFSVNDVFHMYQMYLPPNGAWTPLKLLTWQWTASGEAKPFIGFQPNPPNGSVNVISDVNCCEHPQWTHRHANTW